MYRLKGFISMGAIVTFLGENYITIFLVVIIGIISFWHYRKNRNEISQKIIGTDFKVLFSKEEYKKYKELGDSVLNNTTISFLAENLNNQASKMDLYYRTISVGNQIMKSHTFRISDVGEI